MTKSNSSATLSTSNRYEHPWYAQLQLLENTTTCESQSPPKPKSETPGQTCTKYCTWCEQTLPVEKFHKNSQRLDGLMMICAQCYNSHKRLVRKLKKTSPPPPDNCECCGKETKLQLDHCHNTQNFRGWICVNCNTGIGKLGDSIEGLQKAIDYLNGHQI